MKLMQPTLVDEFVEWVQYMPYALKFYIRLIFRELQIFANLRILFSRMLGMNQYGWPLSTRKTP